ncbi:neprilysin-1-like [Ornithodoros turicata]|uniref:neprilysin-1-like n=1 Tax=Ornithodoros turicata TaxID=34597 RepID=UPI00313936BB
MKHHYAPSPPRGAVLAWQTAKKFWWQVITVLLLVALVACGTYLALCWRSPPSDPGYTVCNSESCKYYAELLSKSLDRKADPCEDFYSYVCGTWNETHSRSIYLDNAYRFVQVVANSLRSTYVGNSSQSSFQKAARFYQSCEDIVLKGRDESQKFKEVLKRAGIEWPKPSPKPDPLLSMLLLSKIVRVESLLAIEYTNRGDSHLFTIYLGSIMADRFAGRISANRPTYERMKNLLADTSGGGLFEYDEFNSTEVTIMDTISNFLRYNNTGEQFHGFSDLPTLTPSISLERWNVTFLRGYELPAEAVLEVHVIDVAFLRAVDALMALIGEHSLHMYVGWCAVISLAPFMSDQMATARYGSPKAAERHVVEDCLRVTESVLGWMSVAQYSYKVFNPHVRLELNKIINDVRYTLLEKMFRSTWISQDMAMEPVRYGSYDTTLGPIEYIEDPSQLDSVLALFPSMSSSLSDNWQKSVEARLLTRSSLITRISSGVLYWLRLNDDFVIPYSEREAYEIPPYSATLPMYEFDVPTAIKYGALGHVISKTYISSLLAGFFDIVRSNGMDSPFGKELLDRMSCFLNSVQNTSSLAYGRVSPVLSNAAAIDIHWDAYIRTRTQERRLEGYRTLRENQSFFVAFCYLHCDVVAKGMNKLSCNNAAMHSSMFAEAFACSSKSTMGGPKKCSLFT